MNSIRYWSFTFTDDVAEFSGYQFKPQLRTVGPKYGKYLKQIQAALAELDGNKELQQFADRLEKACIATIESGKMTKDLALITSLENVEVLNSQNFIKAIKETLEKSL